MNENLLNQDAYNSYLNEYSERKIGMTDDLISTNNTDISECNVIQNCNLVAGFGEQQREKSKNDEELEDEHRFGHLVDKMDKMKRKRMEALRLAAVKQVDQEERKSIILEQELRLENLKYMEKMKQLAKNPNEDATAMPSCFDSCKDNTEELPSIFKKDSKEKNKNNLFIGMVIQKERNGRNNIIKQEVWEYKAMKNALEIEFSVVSEFVPENAIFCTLATALVNLTKFEDEDRKFILNDEKKDFFLILDKFSIEYNYIRGRNNFHSSFLNNSSNKKNCEFNSPVMSGDDNYYNFINNSSSNRNYNSKRAEGSTGFGRYHYMQSWKTSSTGKNTMYSANYYNLQHERRNGKPFIPPTPVYNMIKTYQFALNATPNRLGLARSSQPESRSNTNYRPQSASTLSFLSTPNIYTGSNCANIATASSEPYSSIEDKRGSGSGKPFTPVKLDDFSERNYNSIRNNNYFSPAPAINNGQLVSNITKLPSAPITCSCNEYDNNNSATRVNSTLEYIDKYSIIEHNKDIIYKIPANLNIYERGLGGFEGSMTPSRVRKYYPSRPKTAPNKRS